VQMDRVRQGSHCEGEGPLGIAAGDDNTHCHTMLGCL
jgi:hypothetical protein